MRPRPDEEYEQVPGYRTAYEMIRRMVDRGLLIRHERSDTHDHTLYSLPSVDPISKYHFDHARELGDLYVALKKTGKVSQWRYKWPIGFYEKLPKDVKIKPDAQLLPTGSKQWVFFEHDRGFEKPKTLQEKLDKYEKLQGYCEPFCVVFLFQPVAGRSDMLERMNMFLDMTTKYQRGKKYMCAPYFMLIEDACKPLLVSYNATSKLSVFDIR